MRRIQRPTQGDVRTMNKLFAVHNLVPGRAWCICGMDPRAWMVIAQSSLCNVREGLGDHLEDNPDDHLQCEHGITLLDPVA